MNPVIAYEKHAQKFLERRDSSTVGLQVVDRWARSLRQGAEVLEIACGGGIPVTQALAGSGLQIWAIDPSPTLLKTFNHRFPGIRTQCTSVQECTFFEREFDAAIAVGLIFLLCPSDQITMLNRVASALRPGACFLFTAPMETGKWTDECTGHPCESLGFQVYKEALSDAGFRVDSLQEDRGGNNYFAARKVAGSTSSEHI